MSKKEARKDLKTGKKTHIQKVVPTKKGQTKENLLSGECKPSGMFG